MASSALSIYLIHEHNYISCKLYNYINSLSNMADSNYILFINLLFLALIIMVACILIDKLRMIVTNPIERLILKINWDGYTNKLVKKLLNLI